MLETRYYYYLSKHDSWFGTILCRLNAQMYANASIYLWVKWEIIIRILFYLSRNKQRSLAARLGVTVPVERCLRTDVALDVVTAESAGRPRCRWIFGGLYTRGSWSDSARADRSP